MSHSKIIIIMKMNVLNRYNIASVSNYEYENFCKLKAND